MQYWSASQPTWCADCSRCSVWRHDSSTTCDCTTTSPMRWRHCTGWASQNAFPERVHYKIAVLTYILHDSAPQYLGPLVVSLTYLVGVLCGQQVPAAWSYHPSNCLYCWQPCLFGCCSSSLERSARGRHLIVIAAVFPASTKDSSFSTIVSTPDSLTAYQASLQWSL